jgi:hypothetical protein
MSLYGRTDSNANQTKAGVGIAASEQAKTVIYVDETEAALEANKERGLNAPGWWSYFTYTDSSGATRHKAEQLVFIAGGDTNANETQADDAQAADVAVTIAIGTQPADTAVAVGAQLDLTVVATGTPPGDASLLSFQWQKKSGNRWSNISGATAATFTVATYAATDAGSYRVKINSSNGAKEVISATAVVTTA